MSNPHLIYRIPKLADIFVFTYPPIIIIIYFWGVISRKQKAESWKLSRIYYKKSALFMVASMWVSAAINIWIQFFVDKARPNITLGLIDNKTESILHNWLPTSSFPSDHAVISMAIAVAAFVWWIKNKDKKYLWFALVLFVFSIIMSMSRITAAIHRPTDIIVGSLIGFWVPWILGGKKIYSWLDKIFGWIGRIV